MSHSLGWSNLSDDLLPTPFLFFGREFTMHTMRVNCLTTVFGLEFPMHMKRVNYLTTACINCVNYLFIL